MIVDRYGRSFQNLRVSLTAACNYACTYCVPSGKRLNRQHDELSGRQLMECIELITEVTGIRRLRITGGEPLIAKSFDTLLAHIGQRYQDIAITTNGQFLGQKLALMQACGVKRINLSLDTLNPQGFRSLAKSGDLATVLQGLNQALDRGFSLKVNMVPVAGQNQDQILPLLNYCLDRGVELRFIELMRMGHLYDQQLFSQQFVSMATILDMIRDAGYDFTPAQTERDATAVRYEIKGKGFFGIIANESQPFCKGCSRLRLAANGQLYGCLSNNKSRTMVDLLDMPKYDALALLRQRLALAIQDKQSAFTGGSIIMKSIGG